MERPDLRSPAVLALVAANLVPLAGVLLLGWDLGQVMLLFWAENGVVGLFNALKMASLRRPAALFYVPFFCLHYGIFWVVHGVFVGTFFLGDAEPLATLRGVALALLALVVGHGVSFVTEFLRRERADATLESLMQAPYRRVVVLHLALLGGGFLILALRQPVAALALLVVLKTVVDLRAHRRAHPRPAPAA